MQQGAFNEGMRGGWQKVPEETKAPAGAEAFVENRL